MTDLFTSLPISEEQSDAMRKVSKKCDELLTEFMSYFSENSRYLSICKTKLEEFDLWANKAIARDFKP